MPPMSSVQPKEKRGWAVNGSSPTVEMNRPSSSESVPLTRLPELISAAQDRPSSASQKYSKLENCRRDLGEQRCSEEQGSEADQPADARGGDRDAERPGGLPGLGHRVGFIDIGRRRGRARNAHERAGDIAGGDRHGRAGDDRGDRRDGVHVEGEGDQQGGRHGRRQAGNGADEETEKGGRDDDRQRIGREDEIDGLDENVHGRAPSAEQAHRERHAQSVREKIVDEGGDPPAEKMPEASSEPPPIRTTRATKTKVSGRKPTSGRSGT